MLHELSLFLHVSRIHLLSCWRCSWCSSKVYLTIATTSLSHLSLDFITPFSIFFVFFGGLWFGRRSTDITDWFTRQSDSPYSSLYYFISLCFCVGAWVVDRTTVQVSSSNAEGRVISKKKKREENRKGNPTPSPPLQNKSTPRKSTYTTQKTARRLHLYVWERGNI